jgi:fibronectin-binding autotransporter adhesin
MQFPEVMLVWPQILNTTKTPILMKRTVLLTLFAFGLAQSSRAVNLVWTPLASATWDTSALNWTNAATGGPLVAYTAGDNVRFDDSGLIQPAVTLSGALTPGSVVVDSTGIYTFSSGTLAGSVPLFKRGTGQLILGTDNTISSPTSIEGGQLQIGAGGTTGNIGSGRITNLTGLIINRTGTLTLNNFLTGAGGFTNKLNATVNIWGTNNMSGPILVQIGQLSLSNAVSQGQSKSITLDASTGGTPNPRLGLTGGINLPSDVNLNLMGTTATPNLSRATITTVLATDTANNVVNGPIRIGSGDGLVQLTGVQTNTGELQINGNIFNHPDNVTPFSGSLYVRGNGNVTISGTVNLRDAKLIRTDGGTFTLASTGNYWTNGTLIAVGGLRLGADNALPTSTTFSIGQGAGTNAILDLNGHSQQLPGVTSVHGANVNVPIIANSSTTFDSILTISAPGGAYGGLLQDSILDGTRKVGLRILSGAQQLTTTCTYSGPTTILGGGISLVGAGSIPNTTPITISAGAAIDASSRNDGTFALESAQTLKGDSTFNINGNLTSAGTIELKVNKSGGVVNNDTVAVNGQVTYGGKLKLVLSGEALSPGDVIQVFSAASYAPSSFSTIEPAAPAPGYLWDTTLLASYGILQIVGPLTATAVLAPSRTDITFSGSGGVPNGGFTIVSSADIKAPLGTWGTEQTGTFDGSGNLNVNIAIASGQPRKFFSIRVP